jgi:hypothetical protein
VASTVRVRIYDSRVSDLTTRPGGPVFTWMRDLTEDSAWYARGHVRSRTGHLASTIATAVTPAGRFDCIGTVRCTAGYALFVIAGTGQYNPDSAYDRIYPHGPFLWVPVRRGSAAREKRRHVSGQRPNNFLNKGKRDALALHGLL